MASWMVPRLVQQKGRQKVPRLVQQKGRQKRLVQQKGPRLVQQKGPQKVPRLVQQVVEVVHVVEVVGWVCCRRRCAAQMRIYVFRPGGLG